MVIRNIFYWGLPLLSLIINTFLLLLLSLSKKDRHIRAFMPFIAAAIVWSASSLLMRLQVFPGTLFWNRMLVSSITMVPFFAYIFVSIFTNQVRKLSIVAWSLIILVIHYMNFLGLMVTSAEMVPVVVNGVEIFELSYSIGPLAAIGYGSIFVLLTVCLVKMRKAFKYGDKQSNKLKPVLLGLFILYVGLLLNIVPAIGKYPVDFAFAIVTSGMLMHAIYNSRLIELKIVVTRTLLFTISITALFLLVALIINRVLSFFGNVDTGLNNEIFVLVTALITIILFQPIFSGIYRRIDEHFYKKQNYQQSLIKSFSRTVSNNLNLDNITNEMLQIAHEITRNDRIYVFFRSMESKDYRFYASYKKLDKQSMEIRSSHPFVRWFKNNDEFIPDEYVDNHPFFKTMWDSERQDLLLMRFEVALPLKYDSDLIGMVLLGHNESPTVLSKDDIDVLATLCATASIAINNARMFEKFQNEAIMDSLTGLYNHRYFMDQIDKSCQNLKKQPVTLIMMNIDMFAMFNDIYGSHAGDIALRKIADTIKFVCGSQGIICRYGGDVFAIILPDFDTSNTYEMAEKIRSKVETISMSDKNDVKRHLTVSVGVCVAPSVATDAKDLVDKTTKALHIAKKSGKNKSVIFNPDQHQETIPEEVNEEMNMATIYALTAAIDAKDHYTFGHSQRVAKYASAIAAKAGAPKEEVETIRQAGLLHDIGKIGIPESILTKYSKLEDHEYETMKMHVDMSITIIKYLPSFTHVIPAVLGHHERWDGKGYPRRVKGENNPFSARCIAIADAFDAITSNRHYKTNLSVDYALGEIERHAGTQFDPYLARIFVDMVRNGELIIEPTRNNVY